MEVDKVTQKHTVLSKNTLTENPVLPTSATTHHFANQQSQQKIEVDSSHKLSLKCPVEKCQKLCRRENLLVMHIKHFHREYRHLLESAPNVKDIAMSRIDGRNFNELSSSYVEKIAKLEQKRKLCQSRYMKSNNLISSSLLKLIENNKLESCTSVKKKNCYKSDTSTDKQNNATQSSELENPESSSVIKSVNLETSTEEIAHVNTINLINISENTTKDTPDSENNIEVKSNQFVVENISTNKTIDCVCGSIKKEGHLIQCNVCLYWNHSDCNISFKDFGEDTFVCASCLRLDAELQLENDQQF